MPDRWLIADDGKRVTVERNGAWYSDVDDIEEGLGLVRNQRVRTVVIVHDDGYREERRL